MKNKKPIMDVVMASIGPKKPMENENEEMESGEEYAIAQDVLDAVKANDSKMLAEALEAAFMFFDSKPHVEGPHEEEME